MAVAPGLRVGRYEVLSKLGQGGFGIIYVGRDTELDRDVALKFLRPEHVTRPDVVMRFLQEARSAAKINHPGIVTVFECGQVAGTNTRADGTVYIAMELLAGESLSQRLKRERLLPPAIALGITRQLCAALQAAHMAGIVHRDLKPDNIMLVPDPAMRDGIRVKILDFGVAKLADGQFGPSGGVRTHSAMVLGTPTYMSPEQCKSSAKVDHRSDIYALGCILYELLCGARPYDGDAGEQIAKHQLAPVPVARAVNPDIPVNLDALVTQMLAKTPDERPGSMEFVDEALAAFERAPTQPVALAAGRPVSQAPAPSGTVATYYEAEQAPTKVTAAPPLSSRTLIGGAVGVIALGVLLGVVCTRTSGSSETKTPVAVVREDAGVVASTPPPDAAVEIPTTPDPALVVPTIDDLKIECLKLVAEKQWANVVTCTDRLATADPDMAKSLRAKAIMENKAETATRKVAEAIRSNKLRIAKLELDKIPSDSVYRMQATDAYEAAVPSTTTTAPKQPTMTSCDASGPRAKGEAAEKAGMPAAALTAFEASLACVDDADVRVLAFKAACGSKNKPKALHYWPLLTGNAGEMVRGICTRNGITLTAACDADALAAKGQDHLQTGMDAAALAAFEASMKCRPDEGLLRLAFMAACRSKNEVKAKYYWSKVPPATSDGLRAICTRNNIVLSEPPCNADALRDKGQDYLQTSRDGDALASFEASMKCRPDAGLLRLAFMAACRSSNGPRARYYYPKLPTATTTGIVQICVRNGVTLP